ncbi:aromatic ring-hydroxylating dioxygenase subunit alpha [Sphingomonas sp.]|uniref:aromatic ring-hydroxylating dioxygenase subunit alpha n=1 Tax=Sphingomonas sp. TaxID=28214 RepID=UPI0025F2E2A8|nr:aromatic ring-hydroxylating dioxygenase subunit alpha [Sphingomonas sp.]
MSNAYVLNVWYMAAWQEEVDATDMVTRTLLDRNWLIYRTEDGGYAMLLNRCPHRFAPLSRGRREGDLIECGYHGLRFDRTGTCVHNPFSDLIPPNASIPTYPVVARNGIIWFWPGEAGAADESLIPDYSILDDPTPMVRKRTRMEANYELLADNLLDLSHVEFVHRNSFRSGGAMLKGEHKAYTDEQGAIWSCWSMTNVPAPLFATTLADVPTDRWTNMRWSAPANLYLEVGAAPTGCPRDESPVQPLRNPHIVTPETQTSSHYFYNHKPGEEAAALATQVFENEDRPMLEAVQREMGDAQFWDLRPVILNVDSAAVRARRHLMKLRREEAARRGDSAVTDLAAAE